MSGSRELLELVKILGRIEIVPGFLVVSRDFLKVGRTIVLNETLSFTVKKVFPAPFNILFFDEIKGLETATACNDEEDAISVIDAILESLKESGWSSDWPLSLPKFIPETEFDRI